MQHGSVAAKLRIGCAPSSRRSKAAGR